MKKKIKVAVVGLGYVGLPAAVSFGNKVDTIGFDISIDKIKKLKRYIDPSNEIPSQQIKRSKKLFFQKNI